MFYEILLALTLQGQAPCAPATPLFSDRSAASGLAFVHDNGMAGAMYYPEILGGAAALLDYDGDGDLDLYLVQGGPLSAGPGPTAGDRLLRNDLMPAEPTAAVHFVDVTQAAEIDVHGYGVGIATGDIDGDGFVDLFIPQVGPDVLLRNRGDGTFEDVTAKAGVSRPAWSVAATFFDADGDRDLDLFVVDYVRYDIASNPRCFSASGRRDYCGPSDFPPLPDRLYLNRGDGTFEDVSVQAGIAARPGPGLGVLATDVDSDGRPDILVTNDGAENALWWNHGNGTFEDVGLLSGFALNQSGTPEASMGIDAYDVDHDLDLDVVLSHLDGETNTFYRADGPALFADRSIESGIGAPSLPNTGFGIAFADLDLDGEADLAVANGAVRIMEAQAAAGSSLPLVQPNQLLRGAGGGRFEDASELAGPDFVAANDVSRALVPGDVDRDGDLDILLGTDAGPARLLFNGARQQCASRPWLGVSVVDRTTGGPLQGVEVTLREGDRATLLRQATDGSYASARPAELQTGLRASGPVTLEVHRPGGASTLVLRGLAANRSYRVPVD